MSKGIFCDRMAAAIKNTDVVIIRLDARGKETDRYHIEVKTETDDFGMLRGRESLFIGKATPGALISAIEKAKDKITGTVQMMLEAQDDAEE